MILVTGATGMFGSRVVRELAARGKTVGAMGRSAERLDAVAGPGVTRVVADMDDAASLSGALEGVEAAFLVTPLDDQVAVRETAFVDAAKAAGVRRVVKLYGAVRHHGDPLDEIHRASIEHLRASGMKWALLSPQTVMETNFLTQAQAVKAAGGFWGSAGDGTMAFVAADDCARAAAVVLSDEHGEDGANYEITGPEAVTFAQAAEKLGAVLGKPVTYNDLPDEDFKQMLLQTGMPEEQIEIGVLLHFRAFRRGDADLVTDTYQQLTGEPPTSLDDWFAAHADAFR